MKAIMQVLFSATTGLALAPFAQIRGPLALPRAARAGAGARMGNWAEADVNAASLPLPDSIEGMLSDDTERGPTRQM